MVFRVGNGWSLMVEGRWLNNLEGRKQTLGSSAKKKCLDRTAKLAETVNT
jgi:hypothetical protein